MKLRAAPAVLLVFISLTLGLAACGGSDTPTPEPTPTPVPTPTPIPEPEPSPLPEPTNNSAVLSGEALGSGFTPNAQLRKEISASSTGENTTFRLGAAYATRTEATSETLYWFAAVTNESSELQCGIEATELEFEDSAGRTLVMNAATFVSGSVGVSQSSGIYTDTCLGSGETGYFFGIELEDDAPSLYTSVSRIVISGIDGETGFELPAARIVPQSYEFSEGQGLLVTALNEGTDEARVGDFSHYFFLDENNLPLSWGFFEGDFESPDDNPVVAAGETHVLNEPFLFYDGVSSKLWTFVDSVSVIDPFYADSAFSTEAVDAEAVNARYTAWRTRREDARRQTVAKLRSAHESP